MSIAIGITLFIGGAITGAAMLLAAAAIYGLGEEEAR